MAKDEWTVAHDVIDVGVAVRVEDARTLAAFHEHGVASHGAERPNRAVDPSGETMHRPLHQTGGTIHRKRRSGVYALAATLQSLASPFGNYVSVLYPS